MITRFDAELLVKEWLAPKPVKDLVICRVDEHPWGWMFFVDSKKYLETRALRDAIGGNVPVYVTRDGAFHEPVAGSGVSMAEHLRLFEAGLKAKG
jgi:hypothetical protein